MNTELIIHPTAATEVPVTLIAPGKSGIAKQKRKPRDITAADLRQLVAARGLKATTKHTKAELRAMLTTGVQVRAAAQDRENARRRAKRAAAKQANPEA